MTTQTKTKPAGGTRPAKLYFVRAVIGGDVLGSQRHESAQAAHAEARRLNAQAAERESGWSFYVQPFTA